MAISDIAEAVAAGQTYIIAEIGQTIRATWRLQSSRSIPPQTQA